MGALRFRGNIRVTGTLTLTNDLVVGKTLTASSQTTLTKAVTCSSAVTVTKTLTVSSRATLTKTATFSSGWTLPTQAVTSTATALNPYGVVQMTISGAKSFRLGGAPKVGQSVLLKTNSTGTLKVFTGTPATTINFVNSTGLTKNCLTFTGAAAKCEFAYCVGLSTTKWLIVAHQGIAAGDLTTG
jgi:hypothetical protein